MDKKMFLALALAALFPLGCTNNSTPYSPVVHSYSSGVTLVTGFGLLEDILVFKGNLYAADYAKGWVSKYDLNGNLLGNLTPTGLSGPVGLAGKNNSIYITDYSNGNINVMNESGSHIATHGSLGSAAGQFSQPWAISFDAGGYYYVADANNNRIQKCNSNGSSCVTVGGPVTGTGNGQFNYPQGIFVDNSGNVWVSDSGNSRIQEFDSTLAFLQTFGSFGTGTGQFSNPGALILDPYGNLIVPDYGNHRVEQTTTSGGFLQQIGAGLFSGPWSLAFDSNNNLYVADYNNNQILRFTPN